MLFIVYSGVCCNSSNRFMRRFVHVVVVEYRVDNLPRLLHANFH